jgi:hypothetical protein
MSRTSAPVGDMELQSDEIIVVRDDHHGAAITMYCDTWVDGTAVLCVQKWYRREDVWCRTTRLWLSRSDAKALAEALAKVGQEVGNG